MTDQRSQSRAKDKPIPNRLVGESLKEEQMSTANIATANSVISKTKAMARRVELDKFERSAQIRIKKLEARLERLRTDKEPLMEEHVRLRLRMVGLGSPQEKIARERVAARHDALGSQISQCEKGIETAKQKIISRKNYARRYCALATKYPRIKIDDIPWIVGKELGVVPIHARTNGFRLATFGEPSHVYTTCWDPLLEWPEIAKVWTSSFDSFGDKGDVVGCTLLKRQIGFYYSWLDAKRDEFDANNIRLTYSYARALPPAVKAKMQVAEADFVTDGGFLLLLEDAGLCEVELKRLGTQRFGPSKVSDPPDPLVAGYDPISPDYLWLVT